VGGSEDTGGLSSVALQKDDTPKKKEGRDTLGRHVRLAELLLFYLTTRKMMRQDGDIFSLGAD
jgi:hypothetical protein